MNNIDYTTVRNARLTAADIENTQRHNEREKDSYSNDDIIPERTSMNVHFKKPTAGYAEMFSQMSKDGTISTRSIKDDAYRYGELVFDVNSAYFDNRGGYEYAKRFYREAYKCAVEVVGGEQYILSAVMHADELNRAMSEKLGRDVFHYHLHVVYIPVVEKQILWSKRCKDKLLVGTVKEIVMQVSMSKKWASKPAINKATGDLLRNSQGKLVLKNSYSILQDDFYNHMRSAGYTDIHRGERGSSEEHLTVTQFKVKQETKRLKAVNAELAEQQAKLDRTKQAQKKEMQKLNALQKQAKVASRAAVTIQELKEMGKKSITGNIVLTPNEHSTLLDYAVSSFSEKVEKLKYEESYEAAKHDARIWKDRYENLRAQVQPYLDAVKLAPEKVKAFINDILTKTKETIAHKQPIRHHRQELEI